MYHEHGMSTSQTHLPDGGDNAADDDGEIMQVYSEHIRLLLIANCR